MLAWTIYITFIGVAILCFVKSNDTVTARAVAFLTALGGLFCALGGALQLNASAGITDLVKLPWIPSLGIQFHLGADGISATLVVLTGLASVAGILFSWNVTHRPKEFFLYYLLLIGGVYGVFLSFDLFLLFVFYELAIIPKYFLIAIWGSTNKSYGSMKLALYSFIGSAMVLVGIIAVYATSGGQTASLVELSKASFTSGFQSWAFPLIFVGFAILAGIWPFHTWAPTGHVAAPTAASMLLAGVVMKLGAYGAFRVAMTLFPAGLHMWQMPLATLGTIGIVYGAFVALVQKDFKFVIGYSSVSHMGFVVLGLASYSEIGTTGAILQMFSHGIIAGLLFGVVGRMVYERTHTRDFGLLEGMGLNQKIPFAAVTFVIAGMASMGLPGFSGFIAEMQVLIGAWHASPTVAVVAGCGVVLGVAYTLRAVHKGFFGSPSSKGPQPAHSEHEEEMEPITVPERLGASMLLLTSLVVGLYPRILLDLIIPSFNSPLFEGLRKGGLL